MKYPLKHVNEVSKHKIHFLENLLNYNYQTSPTSNDFFCSGFIFRKWNFFLLEDFGLPCTKNLKNYFVVLWKALSGYLLQIDKLVKVILASSLVYLGVVLDVKLPHSETRDINAFKCTTTFHIWTKRATAWVGEYNRVI